MRYLALDIGKRHTGVAWGDTAIGIPLPLPTITHATVSSLIKELLPVIKERAIDEILIGLPLLPSGKAGSQVAVIEKYAKKFEEYGMVYSFVDERYSTPNRAIEYKNAFAACAILETKFMREK